MSSNKEAVEHVVVEAVDDASRDDHLGGGEVFQGLALRGVVWVDASVDPHAQEDLGLGGLDRAAYGRVGLLPPDEGVGLVRYDAAQGKEVVDLTEVEHRPAALFAQHPARGVAPFPMPNAALPARGAPVIPTIYRRDEGIRVLEVRDDSLRSAS